MQVQFRLLTPILLWYILWLTSISSKEGGTQNETCVYANVSLYNSIYCIMVGHTLQWNTARETCNQYGMKMATVVEDVISKLEAVIRRSVLDTTFRAWIGLLGLMTHSEHNGQKNSDIFIQLIIKVDWFWKFGLNLCYNKIGPYQNITHGLLICAKNESCRTSTGIIANNNDGNTRNNDEHDNYNVTFIHAFICEYHSDTSSDGERQLVDSNCWNYLTSWPLLSLVSSSSHMWSVSSMNIYNMSTTLSYHSAVLSSVLQNSEPKTSSLKYYNPDFSHFVIQGTSSLPLYGTVTNNPDSVTRNVSLTYSLKTSALYSMLESVVPTHVSSSEMMTSKYTNVHITANTHLHSSFISQRQPFSIQTSNSLSTYQEMPSDTLPDELDQTVFMTIHIKPSFILTTSISLDEQREMYTPYSVYSGVIDSSISPKIPASTGSPVHEGNHKENVEQWVYISIAAALVLAFIVIILFLVARKRRKRRSDNGLQISGLSNYLNREQSSRLSGPNDAGTGKVVMHVEAYNRAFDVLRPSYSSVYIYQEPDLGGESDDASEVLAESETIDLDFENSCGQQSNRSSKKDEDQTEIPSRSQNLIYTDVIKTRL